MLVQEQSLASDNVQAETPGLSGKRCPVIELEAAARQCFCRIDKIIQKIHRGVEILIFACRQAENEHQQVRNARLMRIADNASDCLRRCSLLGYVRQSL